MNDPENKGGGGGGAGGGSSGGKINVCLRCWDLTQSKEGRDQIRNVVAPFVLTVSLIFLIIGATWAKFLEPECGIDLKSAHFSISSSGSDRILQGNGCPGYDWQGQKSTQDQRETAGEYPFTFKLPLRPILVAQPFYVDSSHSVDGPIGVALNGVPIWGPSANGGEDTVAQEIIKDCDLRAHQLIDEQAKDLGKTLLESVWPTLPDIYG